MRSAKNISEAMQKRILQHALKILKDKPYTSWRELGLKLRVRQEWLRRKLDHEYRERINRNRRERDRIGKPQDAPEVPKDTRTYTQRWFGDPLPGRSALDKKNEESKNAGADS